MSHVEPLRTSSLAIYPLSSTSSQQALTVFNQLFSSCAGPHGRNHIVRNACGGHLTITSACSRLLSSICFSRSELKLVASAVTGHLQQCGDCGLFMIHICLQLTQSVLDMNIHHSIVSSTFLCFVSIIVDYVKSESCDVRVKSDFSNVKLLLSYVRSILNSKVLLNMQSQDLNQISLTVLNAFVSAIPSVPSQRYSSGVFILGQEKLPIKKCRCMDGIMLECPDFFDGNHDELIDRINLKVFEDDEAQTYIKVALVTCSLSGDLDDIVDATYEGTPQQFSDLEENIFQKMTSFCDSLGKESVALLLCQKVIQPKLKTFLRSKGIIFVDRLGSQPIPFIRDLTGCHPITSPLQDVESQKQFLGKLTTVTFSVENDKSYIVLKNNSSSIVTLVVCSEWEERLSELKLCISTCLKGLESLAREPWLLMGGGCWQMHCSQILKEKVLMTLPEMCEKLSCSETTLRRLLMVFSSCLQKWCLGLKHSSEHLSFDSSFYHCWRVPKNCSLPKSSEKSNNLCSCGFKTMPFANLENLDILLTQENSFLSKKGSDLPQPEIRAIEEYDNVVLDNLTFCMEALHKGVLTSGLLLSIGQFICDRN